MHAGPVQAQGRQVRVHDLARGGSGSASGEIGKIIVDGGVGPAGSLHHPAVHEQGRDRRCPGILINVPLGEAPGPGKRIAPAKNGGFARVAAENNRSAGTSVSDGNKCFTVGALP